MMKNVTITMEEDVVRWAKVHAAKQNMSLSRMLGETLREKMRAERGYDQAMARFFSRPLHPLKEPSSNYPKRGSLYER